MKFLSCLVLCLACLSACPVCGGLTVIADSPDLSNEPNLIGPNPFPNNLNPSVLETLYGEGNLRRVDDSLDVAFRQTSPQAMVKAVARFNNPTIEEILGYSRTVPSEWATALRFQRIQPSFQFPVGYTVPTTGSGLIPLSNSGPTFELRIQSRAHSNPRRNRDRQDMMVTFEIIDNAGHPDNQIGNLVVGFEVFANNDLDFQDVVYELSGVTPLPEPSSAVLIVPLLSLRPWKRS